MAIRNTAALTRLKSPGKVVIDCWYIKVYRGAAIKGAIDCSTFLMENILPENKQM